MSYRVVVELQTSDGTQKHVNWYDFKSYDDGMKAVDAAGAVIENLKEQKRMAEKKVRKRFKIDVD